MPNIEELFKVRYLGKSNCNFTNSDCYSVIQIDEDGDYVLLDNFLNPMQHYSSQFEVTK